MKKILMLLAFLVFTAFSANAQNEPPAVRKEVAAIVWKGKTYRVGDRVKVTSFAGTMKPEETGYKEEVIAGNGRTGTILRGVKRVATSYFEPDPNEPIQIVLIKWDAQKWVRENSQAIALKSFESTIHVEYLEVLPKVKTNLKTKPKIPVKKRRP
jgi:hypothetical protein